MRRAVILLLGVGGLLLAWLVMSPSAQAATNVFKTTLSGANEVPPTSSPITGTVGVTIDDTTNTVCAFLDLQNAQLSDLTMMHIHKGAAGVAGPVVIPFTIGTSTMSCANGVDAALVADIKANPANYYYNVHTAQFPAGAARGQLALVTARVDLTAAISHNNEVPPVTNATTTGTAHIMIDTASDLVCVQLTLQNQSIGNLTAMHIHSGAAGVNGPVVIPFTPGAMACSIGPAATVSDIVAHPAHYYFNVHTQANPAGEARGQLMVPPPPGTSTTSSTSSSTSSSTTTTTAPPSGSGANPVTARPSFTG